MKIKTIMLLTVLLASVVFAANQEYVTSFNFDRRIGVERVTHYDPRIHIAKIDSTVYLDPAQPQIHAGSGRGGYAPMFARGTAKIRSSLWNGQPTASVVIMTKDIPSDHSYQYEVWLVDEDSRYRLSLGTFTTTSYGGIGRLSYRANTYFDQYDFIEVTQEPINDLDVLPGEVILIGELPESKFFDPVPKQGKMLSSTFKKI